MSDLNFAAFQPVLKQVFPDGKYPKETVYKGSVALGLVPKDETAAGLGDNIKVPLRYGDPQGRSADQTKVLGLSTYQTASKHAAFQLTTYNDYCACRITGDVIDRSKRDAGSFVRAATTEIQAALRQLKRSAVHSLYRNGGGAIGRIDTTATVASLVLILTDAADTVWFEVGQTLEAASTDGTSGSRRSGSAQVAAVDRGAGTISTTGTNWSAQITSLATSDYLFVIGDFGAKFPGFDAWVPLSAPSAATFFGVDRTPDVVRLGGVRASSSFAGVPIEEALLNMVELVSRQGGMPDTILMHTQDFANLQKSMGTRARYVMTPSFDAPKIGYKAIEVILGDVEVRIYADRDCPRGRVFVLQLDTWKLYSLGGLPKPLDNDGMNVLRVGTADSVEFQGVYRAVLGCDAPGFNGQFQI